MSLQEQQEQLRKKDLKIKALQDKNRVLEESLVDIRVEYTLLHEKYEQAKLQLELQNTKQDGDTEKEDSEESTDEAG